jgi:MFS family permease
MEKAGAFFGVLIGSWVMDKYGRKVGVMYCATLSIIGGVCLCAAQNIAMFIVFRFFAGAGSWAFLALGTISFSGILIFSLLCSPILQRVGNLADSHMSVQHRYTLPSSPLPNSEAFS